MSSKTKSGQYADPKGIVTQGPTMDHGMFGEGTTVPTDATAGYEEGCLFLKRSSTALSGAQLYVNEGSSTSCDFNALYTRESASATNEVLAGATLTVTQALHDGRTIAMPAVCAITLPAATGTGARYKIYQKVAATTVTITATAADMYGVAWLMSDNSAAALAFNAAGSTIITFDGSTKGGVKGAIVEIEDVATSLLLVRVMSAASGSEATPFS